MPATDLDLDALWDYRARLTDPDDLDAFWRDTLAQSRALATAAEVIPVDTGLRMMETYDVSFSGYGGQRIKAWLQLPHCERPASGLPVIVEYVGAGAGRGLAHEPSFWAVAGYAHLIMDTRGQGSGWRVGHTPDPLTLDEGAPSHEGFVTRGLPRRDAYYYRRLYTDAVLAVDAARTLPGVDGRHVFVEGLSQGGGVAIAAGGLAENLAGVMAEVPFMVDIQRGIQVAGTPPYANIATYLSVHRDLVDEVRDTLAYFDAATLGRRATAPALIAAALMDATTPPSTVFGAFHEYGGEKEMAVYPYNAHEGGGSAFALRKLAFVREHAPA